jgi:hypothetical protein
MRGRNKRRNISLKIRNNRIGHAIAVAAAAVHSVFSHQDIWPSNALS